MSNDRQLAFLAGVAERDRILQNFASDHKLYLGMLRAYAHEICIKRTTPLKDGTVTTDDLHDMCVERDFPMPSDVGIDNRIFGLALSRSRDFEPCGEVLTRNLERIGRAGKGSSYIVVYRLRQPSDTVLQHDKDVA